MVITIQMELGAREKELERATQLLDHFTHAGDTGEFANDDVHQGLVEDAADRLIEAAEAWATAFERVCLVEAGFDPNTGQRRPIQGSGRSSRGT
jgi:hypothetical protein